MTAIHDLSGVEVEHLFGLGSNKGLVKIRAISPDLVMVGQVDPNTAREFAQNLLRAATRAEYEEDLATAAQRAGFDDEVVGMLLSMVRSGEEHRELGT